MKLEINSCLGPPLQPISSIQCLHTIAAPAQDGFSDQMTRGKDVGLGAVAVLTDLVQLV